MQYKQAKTQGVGPGKGKSRGLSPSLSRSSSLKKYNSQKTRPPNNKNDNENADRIRARHGRVCPKAVVQHVTRVLNAYGTFQALAVEWLRMDSAI